MHRIHEELTEAAGEQDPLQGIAKKLASEARVICFDEFFVSDITDAMILGTLLEALFEHNIVFLVKVWTLSCPKKNSYEPSDTKG